MTSEQSTPNTSDIEDGYGTAPDDQPTQPYEVSASQEHKDALKKKKGKLIGAAPMPGGRKKRRKSRRKRKTRKTKRKRRKTRRRRRKTRRRR